jgi:zinc protease
MKYTLLWLSVFTAVLFTNAQQPNNTPLTLNPNVRTGKLANGLTYFILQNKRPEKRMELRLAVNTGSTMEDDNQQGLAHLVEHMAFNGTKHFKKNELVDYLESIGTKFGPHLNAYTSFDETVYMMQVPTDSATQFNKAFLILEDWAGGLSFEPKEIDKERGVVIEEWRLGQGAQERMRNKYWPILFKDSRYAKRLPIGEKQILETAAYERLTSFYKDWYRPDNMAVIAVGDFDVDEVEAKIKSHFSGLTNPANEKKVLSWDIPDQQGLDIAKVTDKEAPYTMIEVVYKHPVFSLKTEGDYRTNMVMQLYNGMLNARLQELMNGAKPPFNYAYTYYGDLVRTKDNYASFAIVSDKNIELGLTSLVDENERVRRFGFTATELERQKLEMMRNMEKSYNERDKTESSRLVWSYVSYFLEGRPAIGAEKGLELYRKFMDGIKLEEVNAKAAEWITPNGKNCIVVIQAPEKEGVVMPSDESIRSLFATAQTKPMKPYIDKVITTPLVARMPKAGSIVSNQKIENGAYTELKLSNGARLVYKKTNFKNDEVIFRATSWGGASLYPEKDDVSASMCGSIMEQSGVGSFDKSALDKYMQGKIVSVYPYVGETQEGMSGRTTPQDVETLTQLVYLYFTAPRKDKTGYESIMEQYSGFIENQQLDPESAFNDTISVTMNSYHPRRRPFTLPVLREANFDRSYAIFKERFSNASDFTFYFVGNVTDSQMQALAVKYFSALPSTGKTETWKDVNIVTPTGQISKTVVKGVEPKSSVNIQFTGNIEYTPQQQLYLQCLMKLMQIKLRETLREEKSGTYGVSCSGSIERIPKTEYGITIEFGCAPTNVDSLTLAAYGVIESIKQIGCDEKDLTKIKETFRRERETNLKENNWWMGKLVSKYTMNDGMPNDQEFEAFFLNLNAGDLKRTANTFLNQANRAYFVLVPEKK